MIPEKPTHTKEEVMFMTQKADVIAIRKTCKADGTGLSHYILMGTKAK